MSPGDAVRLFAAALGLCLVVGACGPETGAPPRADVEALVRAHARAWETGDTATLARLIHPEAVVAYPGRRMGRDAWIAELASFSAAHVDTRIYVHRILVDGDAFAVEWQFATTERETGVRTAVGDAIVGRVRAGAIVEWKEYLDTRVDDLQRAGVLPLEEGAEPFPRPAAADTTFDEGPGTVP